jgi:hypothetical protein
MKKNEFSKTLVILPIILFLGVSVLPIINGNIEKNINFCNISKETNIIHTLRNNPPEEEWNKIFGGEKSESGNTVQMTSDNGYIITGYTISYGAGSWDVWLIKTNSNGDEEWNKTFGGTEIDVGNSVQQTSDNGYIITGLTKSYGDGDYDAWLIKTDSNGVEVWNKTFGGLYYDYGLSVQQTSDNSYIITGTTDSYGAGKADVWLIKTDSNGDEIWNKTFGGTDYDSGYSVQQTSDNSYIITGTTDSYGAGFSDVWLIKTDSNGDEIWNKTFGGLNSDDGSCVQLTSDNGFIITGNTYSYGPGYWDVWLIKTDSNGDEIWNKTFGGTEDDEEGYSVQQTSDEGFVIAGLTWSYGEGASEALLIKTDSNGDEIWNKTFGGIEHDEVYSVDVTSDNGYIIIGETNSYGPTGNSDVWLIKVASENHAPYIPIITGTSNGYVGEEYDFEVVGMDPDGDDVWYYIDWDDGTYEEWIGPYNSGETKLVGHMWGIAGIFKIKVKAKDIYEYESEWSDPFTIIIEEVNNPPTVKITKPERALYFFNQRILPRFIRPAKIIGPITIEADAENEDSGIDKVKFYINGKEIGNDSTEPYTCKWKWNRPRLFHWFIIKVIAIDKTGKTAEDKMIVRKIL